MKTMSSQAGVDGSLLSMTWQIWINTPEMACVHYVSDLLSYLRDHVYLVIAISFNPRPRWCGLWTLTLPLIRTKIFQVSRAK